MDVSNALSILFEYAYRFKNLKSVALKFVVKHLDKLYAGDKNSFGEYKDHPERPALLVDILEPK
ncbi:hypothetical protein BGZ92_006693, partial [Podila epicladia]